MNAIIALCHFCETHGPGTIFCTQTLRDTKIEELNIDNILNNNNCPACNSIGRSVGIVSKDNESNANFLSTQLPIFPELVTLIKQASVRSLSCEISCNKDGGFVFFGDASRGHVLSHTFNISDLQARGFYQLFSIIILMKDKFFLLNIQPFLSESLKKISKELQSYAQKVYSNEQLVNGSERDHRLSGNQRLTQTPRSLIELTNEQNIYAIIHSHFTWVLLAGARFLTENAAIGNFPWTRSKSEIEYINITPEELLLHKNICDGIEDDLQNFYSLRSLKNILQANFPAACYCALTGLQIIIRGPTTKTFNALMCFRKLLPEQFHKLTKVNCSQYIAADDHRIITLATEIAVPQPSNTIFRIDFVGDECCDEVSIKWLGELPIKSPELVMKIIKAVDESLFTDFVLEKQLKVLVQEWKNKITCISRIRSASELNKLKKILGMQQHDQPLINYWIAHL